MNHTFHIFIIWSKKRELFASKKIRKKRNMNFDRMSGLKQSISVTSRVTMIKRLNPDFHYSDHFLAGRIKNCCQTCEQAKEGGTKKKFRFIWRFSFSKRKNTSGGGGLGEGRTLGSTNTTKLFGIKYYTNIYRKTWILHESNCFFCHLGRN